MVQCCLRNPLGHYCEAKSSPCLDSGWVRTAVAALLSTVVRMQRDLETGKKVVHADVS